MSYSFTENIPRSSVEGYHEAERDIYAGMFSKMIKESNISSEGLAWGSLEFKKYDPKPEPSTPLGRSTHNIEKRRLYIEKNGIDTIEFTVSFSECDQCGSANI
jgi:hypothetical protein